jgi:SAM-dependent methyltransferase
LAKLAYLTRSIRKYPFSRYFICQNCHSPRSTVVESKYLVTSLRRCSSCGILFRTPTDLPEENLAFYNKKYKQGFTTDLPDKDRLSKYLESNFSGTEKDYSHYIDAINCLNIRPGERIFDFGCSWGYGSYQFLRAGFDVLSYEISVPRREYGIRNLGINATGDFEEAAHQHSGKFDCFFSAHVLEHVPSPSKIFSAAHNLLKPGGIFLAFFPNGADQHKKLNPQWSKLWGEVHPNVIDDYFLERQFSDWPRILGSTPLPQQFSSDLFGNSKQSVKFSLDNAEMVFAAQKR